MALILLARAAALGALLPLANAARPPAARISRRQGAAMWWAGSLRGAVTVALAFHNWSAPAEGKGPRGGGRRAAGNGGGEAAAEDQMFLLATQFVVLFGTVVMGPATAPVLRLLLPSGGEAAAPEGGGAGSDDEAGGGSSGWGLEGRAFLGVPGAEDAAGPRCGLGL